MSENQERDNGLVGPLDITTELWREYEWFVDGKLRVYKIYKPVSLYYRVGGTTHRVVDSEGVAHCVPTVGHNGCVLRWKNEDATVPVNF